MRTREYELCADAQQAVEYGLHDVAAKIARVIEQGAWRAFTTPMGRRVTHTSFAEFVVKDRPDGLGTDIATVRNVCRDTPWALDLLDQALQRPPGRPERSQSTDDHDAEETLSNRQGLAPTGETTDAALRRLRKERPDLHARVIAGELSPHAAAVEAGFRSRRFSVPGDPGRAAVILRRHFSDADIATLIKGLQGAPGD